MFLGHVDFSERVEIHVGQGEVGPIAENGSQSFIGAEIIVDASHRCQTVAVVMPLRSGIGCGKGSPALLCHRQASPTSHLSRV